jgi:hypothetical protein
MPNPVERARHFRNRAEECLRLADLVWSHELREGYRAIAEAYKALAETELVFAKCPPSDDHPGPCDKAEPLLSDATQSRS